MTESKMMIRALSTILVVLICSKVNQGFHRRCIAQDETTYKNKLYYDLNLEEPLVSNPGKLCATWCHNSTFTHEVLECPNGRVRFEMEPSPANCDHNTYEIYLKTHNAIESECKLERDLSKFKEHTKIDIFVTRNSSSQAQKNIIIDVDYVFTGCYILEICPKNYSHSKQPCNIKPFYITTNYTLGFITMPTVILTNSKHTFEASFFWDSSTKPELELIDVNLYALGPSNQDKEIMNCTLDSSVYVSKSNPEINDSCFCSWSSVEDKYNMECRFPFLEKGDYRVTVMAHDPRCNPDTIWTDLNPEIKNGRDNSHGLHCFWSVHHTYDPPNSTDHVISREGNNFWIFYTSVALIFLIIAVVLLYCYCRIKPPLTVNGGYNPITKDHLQIRLFCKTKILLLYPRDCEPFMEAMESFRTMLKCTGQFEVFDAMDPAQEEDVSLSMNTWGLNLISDPSSKVILVASWCSLRFYEALLDKDRLSYIDKHSFDSLFSYHLDQLFVQKQPYKKIYVVRLDCDNAENLSFEHIVQSRNFTLPQCIEPLVNQLLELPPSQSIAFEDNNEKSIAKLRDCIENYSEYVKDNPNYLNSLIRDNLMIDNQTLDYNVL